jgi:mannose-1-phosphate guanylyltransferase/mannose-6-phosphate isomerase
MTLLTKGSDPITTHLYAVILAGGSGMRFWPLSRELYPKQLLKVLSDRTLIQQTVHRVRPIVPGERIVVVTGAGHAEAIRFQLDDPGGVRKENILAEPVARNTAAAIGWAATEIRRRDPEGIMLVMPADHVIPDEAEFRRATALAVRLARTGRLVTFGIKPTRPETGYGYIRAIKGKPLLTQGRLKALAVTSFTEKPDRATAKRYLRSGRFYWNSGIFVWRAEAILKEMVAALPALSRGLTRLGAALGTPIEAQALDRFYRRAETISIDHGVLQRTRRAAVIPAPFRWSDVGNWSALDEVAKKDRAGNVRIGPIVDLGSRDSILYGEQRLVATIGLRDMVVVDTADATLVCPKDRAQEVKQIVEVLRRRKAPEQLIHKTVQRPWGSYTVLEEGPRYKVKRVTVSRAAVCRSSSTIGGASTGWSRRDRPASPVASGSLNFATTRARRFQRGRRTASKIPAPSPSTSSRCSAGTIWAKTTSCGWRTTTAGLKNVNR